jgi:signal transduction histidine kinase
VQKIFDPFFTTKSSSTGIGLSLCQRIVHDHGGVLGVSTGPLGGAEFTFSIPIRKGDKEKR